MKTNYVLIDYENLQPEHMGLLAAYDFKVMLFLGSNQKKVPAQTAAVLQPLGSRVQYIPISGNGPNALDFHIAYYIGKKSVAEPSAFFHIISADKGFDPLIAHLKADGLLVGRNENLREIPLLKLSKQAAGDELADQLNKVEAHLKKRGKSAPTRVRTLRNTIKTHLGGQLSDTEVMTVIDGLCGRRFLTVDGQKVIYMN